MAQLKPKDLCLGVTIQRSNDPTLQQFQSLRWHTQDFGYDAGPFGVQIWSNGFLVDRAIQKERNSVSRSKEYEEDSVKNLPADVV